VINSLSRNHTYVKVPHEPVSLMNIVIVAVVACVMLSCCAVYRRSTSVECLFYCVHCCSLCVASLMTFVRFTVISIKLGMSSSPKVRLSVCFSLINSLQCFCSLTFFFFQCPLKLYVTVCSVGRLQNFRPICVILPVCTMDVNLQGRQTWQTGQRNLEKFGAENWCLVFSTAKQADSG